MPPKFIVLTTAQNQGPGAGVAADFAGIGALTGNSNQIPGRGPSLLLFDGSGSNAEIIPGLAAALNQDTFVLFNNGLGFPILTSDQRLAVGSPIRGLTAMGDDDVLYSLQGAPAQASFTDGDILYTVVETGQLGNLYYLHYDASLLDNTVPVEISIDSSVRPLTTLHIKVSQDLDTTIGQILTAFQNTPAVSSIITASQYGGSPSDQPNFSDGSFGNGSPVWAPVNNGLLASFLKADGSVQPTADFNWNNFAITGLSHLQANGEVNGTSLRGNGTDPDDVPFAFLHGAGDAYMLLQNKRFSTTGGVLVSLTPESFTGSSSDIIFAVFTIIGTSWFTLGTQAAFQIKATLRVSGGVLTILDQSSAYSYASDVAMTATLATDGSTKFTITVGQPAGQFQWRCVTEIHQISA